MSLFAAAGLCLAAASTDGRAAGGASQVLIQNVGAWDVLITVTDRNQPHGGVILATEKPLSANADLFVGATLDNRGDYHLHWKVQDEGRTKEQEGDCQGARSVPCRVQLFFS